MDNTSTGLTISQMPLPLEMPAGDTLASFVVGDNQELFDLIENGAIDQEGLFIWGPKACGKSHVLAALCHLAREKGRRALYVPMQVMSHLDHDVVHAFEGYDLIAIDDIDAIANAYGWSEVLFNLYNRHVDQGGQMIFSSAQKPQSINMVLNDLKTRMLHGLSYYLHPLDDQGLHVALNNLALQRGLHLDDEVGAFLLKRVTRDMNSLKEIFNQLDLASWTHQRRLTVPFVKSVLDW